MIDLSPSTGQAIGAVSAALGVTLGPAAKLAMTLA
jgi:hypothetical protein